MDDLTTTDVIAESSPASEAPVSTGAVSAPADVQGESAQGTATQGQEQATAEQETKEAAAPFQIPENDDDLKGQENNPHVQAIVQLRQELRARDSRLDEYKPLESWKPLVEQIGDPQLAQSSYSLVSSIHTPSEESPSGFTSRPFIDQIDQESPGTANQLFVDLCSYTYTDENGQLTTPVREMYKAHGLNPDRIDEYRNIDNLRASGVVTEADLTKIPEKYHEAFKSLTEDARTDILSLKETNPALAEQYLRNAERSLASEKFEAAQLAEKETQKQADESAFQQRVEQAVTTDVTTKVKSWNDSIHQNLSSQWKPFGEDAGANSLEYAKVLSVLATLQSPAYRFVAEQALKQVGASLEGFDDLANQWQAARSKFVVFSEMKDQWQAKRAESEASLAEQRLLIKLNDYALKLAHAKSNGLTQQATQTATQLAAAQGRFVPSGNGQTQQGFQNPYEQNPHPVGSTEYFAYNRKVDKEYSLTNASVFGG